MKVTSIFTGVANTHIVEIAQGVVIVDAGMPHKASYILNTIRKLGYSPQDVRAILLTHGHIDHAGSAVALKKMTGAPVFMHRGDERLTTTPGLKIPPGRTTLTNVSGKVATQLGFLVPIETFTADIALEDGMRLHDRGIDAHVIHTPGHTAGSVSFLFDDGSLFVGDTLLNSSRVGFPLWWEDGPATHKSACKIRALEPRMIYTGHGNAFGLKELAAFIGDHCGE